MQYLSKKSNSQHTKPEMCERTEKSLLDQARGI